jgi:hypothetical protein
MIDIIMNLIAWGVALVFSPLVAESIAFGDRQSTYKRGMDEDLSYVDAIKYQFNNYMKDRFDNLGKKYGYAIFLVLVLGAGGNAAGVTEYLIEKLGFEGLSINLGGAALCFAIVAFSEFIGNKLGINKKEK